MTSKTHEFLNFLLWSADQLQRPSLRYLGESFEAWTYRKGYQRQLSRLEERKLIESESGPAGDRLYRLTPRGRLCALGDRDPIERWSRAWDGKWRLVLFDIPITQNSRRLRLRRYLRSNGFGFLQNSVWVTPDTLSKERKILEVGEIRVESLLLLEARPCADESDSDIVSGAWDFDSINRRYDRHLELLHERPTGAITTEVEANALMRWGRAEQAAWLEAVSSDPLLPAKLLPDNYRGQRAWRRRVDVLGEAARQIRNFRPK